MPGTPHLGDFQTNSTGSYQCGGAAALKWLSSSPCLWGRGQPPFHFCCLYPRPPIARDHECRLTFKSTSPFQLRIMVSDLELLILCFTLFNSTFFFIPLLHTRTHTILKLRFDVMCLIIHYFHYSPFALLCRTTTVNPPPRLNIPYKCGLDVQNLLCRCFLVNQNMLTTDVLPRDCVCTCASYSLRADLNTELVF